MHGELARRVDREEPRGELDGAPQGAAAQLVGLGERVRPGAAAVDPHAALQGEPHEHRDAQAHTAGLGQLEVAQAQGHRDLHGAAVRVPDRVVPARIGRGQGGLDDGGLGGQLGEVTVENLPRPVDELSVLGPGGLARGVPWPPIRLRGSDRALSSSCSIRESAKSTALRYAATQRARSSNMPHTWL